MRLTFGGLIFVIGVILFVLFCWNVWDGATVSETDYQDITIQNISGISDTHSISGSFVLGTGSIHESPQYYFYSKTGNEYRLNWIPALPDHTVIVEDEEMYPYLETIVSKTKSCDRHDRCYSYYKNLFPSASTEYRIHVPFGTVKQPFALNGV